MDYTRGAVFQAPEAEQSSAEAGHIEVPSEAPEGQNLGLGDAVAEES